MADNMRCIIMHMFLNPDKYSWFLNEAVVCVHIDGGEEDLNQRRHMVSGLEASYKEKYLRLKKFSFYGDVYIEGNVSSISKDYFNVLSPFYNQNISDSPSIISKSGFLQSLKVGCRRSTLIPEDCY